MQPREELKVSEEEKQQFEKNLPQMVSEKKFEEIISQLPKFLEDNPENIIFQLISPYENENKKNIKKWIEFFIALQDSSILSSKIDFSSLWLDVLKITVIPEEEQKKEDVRLFYTRFILMIITQYSQKKPALLHQLASNNNFLFCLLDVISNLELELKKDIQNKFIHLAIEKYNPFLLEKLTKEIPLESVTPLETKEKATKLLEVKKESWVFLHENMKAFVNGIGIGIINYHNVLLTCAQIAARKKYSFHPTIIKTYEADEYFFALSRAKLPIRERFIVTGAHFYPGDVMIDEKKHATLLIADSLQGEALTLTKHTLFTLKKYFPNSTIYIPQEHRQVTMKGCSVFSLDDLRHLHTIEQYLPSEYKKENGLFDYLKDNSEKEIFLTKKQNTITVKLCHLPLSLERTRQNENLLKELIPTRTFENKLPINKRGETAAESVSKYVQEAKNKKGEKRQYNKRLERQLEKMAAYNANYILNHSMQNIKDSMQQFTLRGFQKRMEQRSLLAPIREKLLYFLNTFHEWLKSITEKKTDLLFSKESDVVLKQQISQALTNLKKEDVNILNIAKTVSKSILEYQKSLLTSKPLTEFLLSFHLSLSDLNNKEEWFKMLEKPDNQDIPTQTASKRIT